MLKSLSRKLSRVSLSLILLAAQMMPFFAITPRASALDTGFKVPTSTNGDNDDASSWDNNAVSSVQASDNVYASDDDEDDEQDWAGFGFAIPSGSIIDGIEVKVEAKSTDSTGCEMMVRLSWAGGANGTSTQTKDAELKGQDTIHTFGGANDKWGRNWTPTELNDGNFVLRINIDDLSMSQGGSCNNDAVFYIDHIQAKVHYSEGQPTGNDIVCDDGTNGWVKVDDGNGTVNGAWGSINWGNATYTADGKNFVYSVNSGYELDVCIKSGINAFQNGDDVNGFKKTFTNLTGSSTLTSYIAKDISHVSYRFRQTQPTTFNLTVKKHVINDNGGMLNADDFGIGISGFSDFVFGAPTATTGVTKTYQSAAQYNVRTAPFVLGEDDVDFYTEGNWMCTGTNGVVYSGLTVSLTPLAGENIICEITNDDMPRNVELTIRKVVVNDNGGLLDGDDFGIAISGFSPVVFGPAVSVDGFISTYQTTSAFPQTEEPFVLSEIDTVGYTEGAWECSGTNFVDYDGTTVSLHPRAGEKVVCEITNDDQQGSITLVKKVVNDHNGTKKVSDFNLFVDGQQVTSGVALMLNAGNYTASEQQLQGYDAEGWMGACDMQGNFTLALGQQLVCTITNNDKPGRIVVHKTVKNNNGGDKQANDFRFKLNNGQWQYFNNNGVNEIEVKAGWYTITEDERYGYDADYKGCYKVYVKNGETKHCYVENNDIAPEVKIEKWTDPKWSTQDFDFELKNNDITYKNFSLDGHPYDDNTPQSYETGRYFKAGWVEVIEEEQVGWEQAWTKCYAKGSRGYYPVAHPFKAELGKKYLCKVKNVQDGAVVVTKFHDINENGTWDEDEPTLQGWEINLGGTNECEVVEAPEIEEDITRMTYGADYSHWTPDCGEGVQDDQQVTDKNGVAEFIYVKPGRYTVSEVMQDGWVQSGLYCDNKMHMQEMSFERNSSQEGYGWYEGGAAYVKAGKTVHCYVGNHREPKITIVKTNDTLQCTTRGSLLTFSIVVSVPAVVESGAVYGKIGSPYVPVVIVDDLAEGFEYVAGSFTAQSSVRGNLVSNGITADPMYTSPGTWNVTSELSNIIVSGEVITLTYKAVVGAAVNAGNYPTEANVLGYNVSATNEVTGSDEDAVCVSVPAVLGASTTPPAKTLAATGNNFTLQLVAGLSMLVVTLYLTRTQKSAKL